MTLMADQQALHGLLTASVDEVNHTRVLKEVQPAKFYLVQGSIP